MSPRPWLAAAVLLAGCAHFEPSLGHREVSTLVEERSGTATGWKDGPPPEEQVQQRVNALLAPGLTRKTALEIALVNNRALQQRYEELGISQADMVQAGLLKNPTFSGSFGVPYGVASLVETEFSVVQDFLDLFVLPLRKEIAEKQFAADQVRVAHEALAVAAEVSEAFSQVQAAEKLLGVRRAVSQAMEASALLAKRQREAGNATQLRDLTERARFEGAQLELARAELDRVVAREKLTRLLGLFGKQAEWTLKEELPELPAKDPPLDRLEATAIRQRLDVEAARRQAELLGRAVSLAKTWRFVGTLEIGVHTHQDANGPRLLGPTLTLELPIFDQRQATIARLEAQQRQAERRLAELSVDARSEVRVAAARLTTARKIAEHYQKTLLPLRSEVVTQSQLQYNGMLIGLYELLDAKQAQIDGFRDYVQSLSDYWIAQAELERAVGGRITRTLEEQQR